MNALGWVGLAIAAPLVLACFWAIGVGPKQEIPKPAPDGASKEK